jgi:UDP-N-acetylglucosamine:LPS N-acetylglucosamine transferase
MRAHDSVPPEPVGAGSAARRVLIVSASMGAGHDGVSGELRRRLTGAGAAVDAVDFLDLFPAHLGPGLRRMYWLQLRYAPWSYESTYRMWMRTPRLVRLVTAAMSRLTGGRLLDAIDAAGADLVVLTYPVVPLVLGRARRRGDLGVPVVTLATDFAVHHLWTHPGVDLALCVSSASAAMATGRRVLATGPVVAPRFFALPDRSRAREELGLPTDVVIPVVLAGAWGAGDITRTVADLVALGYPPVVVCGHNQELHDRLRGRPEVIVYGWTDRIPQLLAACDVVVENAGGLSCMEAFAARRPVVTYRPIAGHGKHNAAMMRAAGCVQLATDREGLRRALGRALGPEGKDAAERAAALFRADAAAAVTALLPTVGRG